jgi:hypothetical protein
VLGYSLTAAMGGWLARACPRVEAAILDDALVDVEVPVLAFWGTDDDIVESFDIIADLAVALSDRGIATLTLAGCDHVSAILRLGDVVDDLMHWLDRQS